MQRYIVDSPHPFMANLNVQYSYSQPYAYTYSRTTEAPLVHWSFFLFRSFSSFLANTVASHSSISSSASFSDLPLPSTPRPPLIFRRMSSILDMSNAQSVPPATIIAKLQTLSVAKFSASNASKPALKVVFGLVFGW